MLINLIKFNRGGMWAIRPLLALLGALFVFAAPVSAIAQNSTYNVAGNFTAPATGSFSGSYVVNTASNTIVSINLQVTAGLAADGATAVPANTYTYAGFEGASLATFATSTPATGQRGGFFAFNGTKAMPTSPVAIQEGVCINPACSGVGNPGRAGSGTVALAPVAAVPTLSEWAMILFGMILAGSAALYIQRRRLTA